ncbi:MAG: oxidoreductase [candidate division WOR-3 bacterium]
MAKLKFAFYWAASCGGCEIAVLDINEKILDVIALADIVFWPVALDVKYKDVENFPQGFIDVTFFNGSVRNSEQEHLAKVLREKSKILIAFGSCAHKGCIPGLANLFSREEILERIYKNSPSTNNPKGILPKTEFENLTLPEFYEQVFPLDKVVPVDYYLPGCPPPTNLISEAVEKIAQGKLPEKGSVLAPVKALCEDCARNPKEAKKMPDIKRMIEISPDPKKCFLEEGVICLGPVTRSGCQTRCINANWPCTGCLGPTPEVFDQGAKAISAIASILALDKEKSLPEEELDQMIEKISDPVGTFYMYSLPSSLIPKRRRR